MRYSSSSTTDKMDDFEAVSGGDLGFWPGGAGGYLAVELYSYSISFQL
jgi:hypothetical protein